MKKKALLICLFLGVMGSFCLGNDGVPVAVSPGNSHGVALVESRCPTFSWSGVPWAKKYRLAVFLVEGGARALVGEMKLATSPVLSQETAAGGSSWTPGADQALADGQEYAWCVGALDANGAWTWSDLARFRVDGSARRMPAEERQAEAEKRALESGGLPQGGGAAAGDAGNRKSPKEESRSVQGTEGTYSTFYGNGAGASNSSDNNQNSFFGRSAGAGVSSGTLNTYVGAYAGSAILENSTGSENTFVGSFAGYAITTGHSNNFIGHSAGNVNTTGFENNFIGFEAGYSNTTGFSNTFLGYFSGRNNTSGEYNTFLGNGSGYANETGVGNLFVGGFAGQYTHGSYNTCIGFEAGRFNPLGSGNVFLGYGAGSNETGSRKLYIDNSDTSSPLIYGDFAADLLRVNGTLETTRTGSNNVLSVTRTDGASFKLSAMGASGQLGTVSSHPVNIMTSNVKRMTVAVSGNVGIGVTVPAYPLHMASGAHCTAGGVWTNASSLALKENIAVLGVAEAAAALRTLNPVKYNYKSDASEKYVGFIAEEVPDLVAQNDRNGLSPMDIVAVLTKVVQEQQKEIAQLKEEMAELKRRPRLD